MKYFTFLDWVITFRWMIYGQFIESCLTNALMLKNVKVTENHQPHALDKFSIQYTSVTQGKVIRFQATKLSIILERIKTIESQPVYTTP